MTQTNHSKTLTYLNGQPVKHLSVQDRAVQYGDGFFTTLLVVNDRVLNWSAHWRRLRQSAERLQFAALDESLLLQQTAQAVAAFNPECNATHIVKLLVSRGESGRGYAIPERATPLVLVQISHAPTQVTVSQSATKMPALNFPPPMALQVQVCNTHTSIQMQLAGIKHLNRLDSVLAQTEVRQKQQQEGIMLNALEQVVGGTQSNVFMIKAQTLITPKLHLSGVEGTTRYQLSHLAPLLGLRWQEADLSLEELLSADELFLSNAVRGIMPIKQLEQQCFSTKQGIEIHHSWNQWQAENALFLKGDLCTKGCTDKKG
ncbi:MAG: aminodeoxychorismate lyase [Thiomicrorhabdus sp.]|nr:aminodeoxychorismate lyase [Thiomicrorhabdus sp.]